MALTIADRVRETTITTGTGSVTLAGAATGLQTFASRVAVGDQCNYVISLGAEWEVGVGTLATSTTLARTTVLASSNANGLVSFSAGTKDVFLTQPAGLMDSMLQRNRNLVDNGAMNVHQRVPAGAIVSNITTSAIWTADRWYTWINVLGTWQQTVDALSPPAGTGIMKSFKMACTTTDTTPGNPDYLFIYQAIEGQFLQHLLKGTASAKSLTLSFWVKSTTTGMYVAELTDQDNGRYISAAYTINVANTWEFKTIVFPGDTTGALDNDANGSLLLVFWLAAGTAYDSGVLNTTWNTSAGSGRAKGQVNLAALNTNTWNITGIQLEVGSIATPYETRQFDKELITCQRYFEKSYNYADAPTTNTAVGGLYEIGRAQSTASIDPGPMIKFKVRKRATPTVVFHLIAGGAPNATWLWGGVGAVTNLYQAGEFGFATYSAATISGLVAGQLYTVTGHWTASADL